MKLNDLRLGILGGGQLGKMLCQVASSWNLETYVLDPSYDCPCSDICNNFFQGDLNDYETVLKFGNFVDILTIEIEHVNSDALIKLKDMGVEVRPDPEILKIIQNKGKQKNFYTNNHLPTSNYIIVKSRDELMELINSGKRTYPFVQKTCELGYDGKGVKVVRSDKDINDILPGESVIEDLVNIKKEISVIVSRNKNSEIKTFPPVEMIFSNEANLVEYLICPTELDEAILSKVNEIAVETISSFGLLGILAVEMFIDENNNVLINEVAPRPHNSGHHTIEASVTSQYEQCLRALFDLSLGSTEILSPSVMVNILGQPGHRGEVIYNGLEDCMSVEGAKFHIYGKTETKPYRKMGHVTVLDKNISSAKEKANYIKGKLKAIS